MRAIFLMSLCIHSLCFLSVKPVYRCSDTTACYNLLYLMSAKYLSKAWGRLTYYCCAVLLQHLFAFVLSKPAVDLNKSYCIPWLLQLITLTVFNSICCQYRYILKVQIFGIVIWNSYCIVWCVIKPFHFQLWLYPSWTFSLMIHKFTHMNMHFYGFFPWRMWRWKSCWSSLLC